MSQGNEPVIRPRKKKVRKVANYEKFIESLNVNDEAIKHLDNEFMTSVHRQSGDFYGNLQRASFETSNEMNGD